MGEAVWPEAAGPVAAPGLRVGRPYVLVGLI